MIKRMSQYFVELRISKGLQPYENAVAFMENRAKEIRAGSAPEALWFLEHPPLYTAGVSADAGELLAPGRLPVFKSKRGGRYTYHGPGQRVAYVMLDLSRRGNNVRAFVQSLENWVIGALACLGVSGQRRQGRIGIWVDRGAGFDEKIAAIGVRVTRSVSYHGVAINVDPDLSHFLDIIPCGISGHGVTSLKALGVNASMADVDFALISSFVETFKTPIMVAPMGDI